MKSSYYIGYVVSEKDEFYRLKDILEMMGLDVSDMKYPDTSTTHYVCVNHSSHVVVIESRQKIYSLVSDIDQFVEILEKDMSLPFIYYKGVLLQQWYTIETVDPSNGVKDNWVVLKGVDEMWTCYSLSSNEVRYFNYIKTFYRILAIRDECDHTLRLHLTLGSPLYGVDRKKVVLTKSEIAKKFNIDEDLIDIK